MLKKLPLFALLFLMVSPFVEAQEKTTAQIKNLIKQYQEDRRGPYSGIKWFCKDGSLREARDPCPDDIDGGIQHATFKSSAIDLRKSNRLILVKF